jgi:methionyl-tRNA formyltransferase
MRLAFAGTPEFAMSALDAILAAGHQVVGVLTQPDRRAGRGMRLIPSAVKRRAEAAGIPLLQPASLRGAESQGELAAWFATGRAELMVVAAYGLILPPAVLALPRLGCINIHASLLPRWRGAAPIERAILAGDTETGISIMQMEEGLDTGPLLLTQVLPIGPRETGGSLRERLTGLGAAAVLEAIGKMDRGENLAPRAQSKDGVTYAGKIDKDEAALDFSLSAIELDRRVRAFDPVPGAFAAFRGEKLKIWRARPGESGSSQAPGTLRTVTPSGLEIACGKQGADTLIAEELQKPGGKRLAAAQFLAGTRLQPGERIDRGV